MIESESPEAEAGRLEAARRSIAVRQRRRLHAVIAETMGHPVVRFDWAGWRRNREELISALRSSTYWSERTRRAIDRAERQYRDPEQASDELLVNRAVQRFEPGHPRIELE